MVVERHIDMGAIAASSSDSINLHDYPELPHHATIEYAIIRNSSLSTLTVQNVPGLQIDPGERVEVQVNGPEVVLETDGTAAAAGKVRVTIGIGGLD